MMPNMSADFSLLYWRCELIGAVMHIIQYENTYLDYYRL